MTTLHEILARAEEIRNNWIHRGHPTFEEVDAMCALLPPLIAVARAAPLVLERHVLQEHVDNARAELRNALVALAVVELPR